MWRLQWLAFGESWQRHDNKKTRPENPSQRCSNLGCLQTRKLPENTAKGKPDLFGQVIAWQ